MKFIRTPFFTIKIFENDATQAVGIKVEAGQYESVFSNPGLYKDLAQSLEDAAKQLREYQAYHDLKKYDGKVLRIRDDYDRICEGKFRLFDKPREDGSIYSFVLYYPADVDGWDIALAESDIIEVVGTWKGL